MSSSRDRLSFVLQALGFACPVFVVFRVLILESALDVPAGVRAMTAVASPFMFLGTWFGAIALWVLLRRQGRSSFLTLPIVVLAGLVVGWAYLLVRAPALRGSRASISDSSVLTLGGMLVPVFLAFMAVLARQQNPRSSPPDWMPWALVGTGAYLLYAVGCLIFLAKNLDGEMGCRFRERGKDPAVLLHAAGIAVWLPLAILPLLVSFAGGPLTFVYAGCLLSVVGIAWWSWWCGGRDGTSTPASNAS